MPGWSKLFSSLVTSSLWCEDHPTIRVWIAMLATCDNEGRVEGSVPGFASLCRVSIPELESALAKFRAPDPHSRSKNDEGRRIRDIDGGWFIINYPEYRDRGQAKEGSRAPYMRKRRATKCNVLQPSVTRDTEAEAEAEVEADAEAEADSNNEKQQTLIISRKGEMIPARPEADEEAPPTEQTDVGPPRAPHPGHFAGMDYAGRPCSCAAVAVAVPAAVVSAASPQVVVVEAVESMFDRFWAVYPRRTAKKLCKAIFAKLKPSEGLTAKMLEAIAVQSKCEQWRDVNLIPHPATWLRQGRWDDDPKAHPATGGRNGKRERFDATALIGLARQASEFRNPALPG